MTRTRTHDRRRTALWILAALAAVVLVCALGVYLTSPRSGGPMDAASTSPDGAAALVALLGEHGVEVTVAGSLADVERAAAPDTLVVAAQTFYLADEQQLRRLGAVGADLLLVDPAPRVREALAPQLRLRPAGSIGGDPDCDLREAVRSGEAQLGLSDTFEAPGGPPLTSCYQGAVVRFTDGARTTTVVGSAEFMTNAGLLKQGNAALAMNLAGDQPHVIWYAPQGFEGDSPNGQTITDLIPDQALWVVAQLCLAVVLLAAWKARRVGPLVTEALPVVVRASESVEGHGRLYRSRRARDSAAGALRTATLQRLLPRLGLRPSTGGPAVVAAVAARTGLDPAAVGHALFGPVPDTDENLVRLSHHLDDIERQVAQA